MGYTPDGDPSEVARFVDSPGLAGFTMYHAGPKDGSMGSQRGTRRSSQEQKEAKGGAGHGQMSRGCLEGVRAATRAQL